jgi:hypothetical protein
VHAREGFQTLRRIALLLLALAVLTDRAGTRGDAVRSRVLSFLRPAEEAARELAEDLAPLLLPGTVRNGDLDGAPYPEDCTLPGDSAQDAAELAQTFRALALLFFALASRCPARARLARPRLVCRATGRETHDGRPRRARRRARAPPWPMATSINAAEIGAPEASWRSTGTL